MKRQYKMYFVVLKKERMGIGIFKSLAQCADFLNITPRMLYYRMNNISFYETNEYIVWKNVPLHNIRRGFGK